MGVIKHNAIIVTAYSFDDCNTANIKAENIFDGVSNLARRGMVSSITKSKANDIYSFIIGPDGSKEGWEISNNYDKRRAKFIKWLKKRSDIYDFIEVRYGGDDDVCEVVG